MNNIFFITICGEELCACVYSKEKIILKRKIMDNYMQLFLDSLLLFLFLFF